MTRTITTVIPARDVPDWLALGWTDLGEMPYGQRGEGKHRTDRRLP